MTKLNVRSALIDVKEFLGRDGDYLRTMVETIVQDRQGRFSTELFERYQRSEQALVSTLIEMYVQLDRQDN